MIDTEKLVAALGIEIRSESGDNLKALCPMHKERTGKVDSKPSWSIHRETGQHYCFSCEYGGSARGLVRDVLGMESANEAWRWLVSHNLADLTVSSYDEAVQRRHGNRRTHQRETETVTEAHLMMYDEDIPPKQLKRRRLKQRSCTHYGVRWADRIHTKAGDMRNAWVIPIRLPDGALLGYQAKPLRGHPLNVPESMVKSATLFGAWAWSGDFVVLVESPLDVVRLHSLGMPNALAAMGTSVSDVQMDIVMDLTDEVVLAFDFDDAGRAATQRVLEQYKRRLRLRRFNYRPAVNSHRRGFYDSLPKDVGEMDPEDIFDGLENTAGAVAW